MARNVCLAQVNNKFGENKVFLPYSVGLLQAHAQAQPDLRGEYNFARSIFMREDPSTTARSMNNPDVVGISCYIWNWEWSRALAKEVKRQHPNSLVVMGGPQVPNRSDDFFHGNRNSLVNIVSQQTPNRSDDSSHRAHGHPFVDILVHGEGEVIFSEILRERLKVSPDYTKISGLTVRKDGSSVKTLSRPRLTPEEFLMLPSPYLDGVFDGLLRDFPDLEFHVTSETHRGCPFSCTFCDWGSAVLTKMRRFSDERIRAEYKWTALHKIPLIYNADANFGIFDRDEELTDFLISLKRTFGFPQQLRANWAKNSHKRMYDMAKKLTDADMGIGVTLSLQSLDKKVLENIKRKNIKFDDFTGLVRKYEEAKIPTYTELILALPGETYQTFTRGLETLFEGGQHEGVNIYLCTLLPNSEMSNPEYIKRYGIKSIRSPILQNHATPGEDPIREFSDMVVATDSMPPEDFRRAIIYSWVTQTFHSIGLTRDIANYLKQRGVSYQSFYEGLISENPDTLVGQQIAAANKCLDRALRGGDWGKINPKYGQVTWPFEEISFLDIATGDLKLFYGQVEKMIGRKFSSIPNEVIKRQMARVRTPEEFRGDVIEYARQVVWFGRKFGSALRNLGGNNQIRTNPYSDIDSGMPSAN
ncbi:MAG: radical SAM protein [Nanoarchaeota archaeon]